MKQDPHLKNNTERADRVAQVVECLTSKCKALSSNPSTTKKGGGGGRKEIKLRFIEPHYVPDPRYPYKPVL
jgi:hypothetical protein